MVLAFPSLEVVETQTAIEPLTVPYIPGLLSFREIPGLVASLAKVQSPVDVILCDGQGIAHPRGVGLAKGPYRLRVVATPPEGEPEAAIVRFRIS